jgi:hypothetical protein
MKRLVALLPLLACGGGSTTPVVVRYNFAVVVGRNQQSTASDAASPTNVTSQLTRDPQGTFASSVVKGVGDFIAPIAYAQGLTLSGTPVAGALVCGVQTPFGEPQIVPLCAFTLADGKAANTVVGGTKSGIYNVVFYAQVPSQLPVKDSTTFTVQPGAPVHNNNGGSANIMVGDSLDLRALMLQNRVTIVDKFGNVIYQPGDTASKFTPSHAVCNDHAPTTVLFGCMNVPFAAAPDTTAWIVPAAMIDAIEALAPQQSGVIVYLFGSGVPIWSVSVGVCRPATATYKC